MDQTFSQVGDLDDDYSDVSVDNDSIGEVEDVELADDATDSGEDNDDEDIETIVKPIAKSARIEKRGTDRITKPILNKFELVNAVIRVIKQINDGAKLPKITEGTSINKDTDVFYLAFRSVMATVKHTIDEPDRSPEQIRKCASVIIQRDVGTKFTEQWALHELVWLEAYPDEYELTQEVKNEYFVDPSNLKIGDWYIR